MKTYWFGVATLPILAAVIVACLVLYRRTTAWLEGRLGVTVEFKVKRRADEISPYVLRNNIWWERTFGPIFTGGWYREHRGPEFTRWIGLGSADGPCLTTFRKVRVGGTP